MIAIRSIDTRPARDMGHGGIDVDTVTAIEIDPRKQSVKVYQRDSSDLMTPDEYYGLRVLRVLQARPDENALAAYLDSEEGQMFLVDVCECWVEVWDGSNNVGLLTDEAVVALEDLLSGIEGLPESEWGRWNLDDWYKMHHGITAEMTDDDLRERAAEDEAEARERKVILDGDVLKYLTQIRDKARKAETAQSIWP